MEQGQGFLLSQVGFKSSVLVSVNAIDKRTLLSSDATILERPSTYYDNIDGRHWYCDTQKSTQYRMQRLR